MVELFNSLLAVTREGHHTLRYDAFSFIEFLEEIEMAFV